MIAIVNHKGGVGKSTTAVSLGAGHLRTFTRVVLPLLTGTAFSIFIYFFINGMVTVSAVIPLHSSTPTARMSRRCPTSAQRPSGRPTAA